MCIVLPTEHCLYSPEACTFLLHVTRKQVLQFACSHTLFPLSRNTKVTNLAKEACTECSSSLPGSLSKKDSCFCLWEARIHNVRKPQNIEASLNAAEQPHARQKYAREGEL